MKNPSEFLERLNRPDLSRLLKFSRFEFGDMDVSDFFFDQIVRVAIVISPPTFTEALAGLVEWDKKRIGEAIANSFPEQGIDTDRVSFNSDAAIMVPESELLYPEIVIHRNQMIAVATGNERIQDVNDYYRVRHKRITDTLTSLGIEHSNPHEDLWDWYHKWKQEFGSYKERREYVNSLYATVFKSFFNGKPVVVIPREPTGWERVDRGLSKAHFQMKRAHHEEDFQAIGLLCREVLISLGQAVYDPSIHQTPDGVTPSSTDAGRMIEAFLSIEIQGASNENLRKHAKAALKLAVELQHKRTAEFRISALCLEATASVVNIVTILSGRRDKRK